ncbi:MAG: S9 family peptidase [Myxococcales bacterium]|nr:S9 family peptidase [Myxococcales bacterium]
MRRSLWSMALFLAAACGGPSAPPAARPTPVPVAPVPPAPPPVAPAAVTPPIATARVVTDRYHGVDVADPYQWLEGDGPEVTAWSDGQDAYARHVLDHLPTVAALRDELRAIYTAPTTNYGDLKAAGGKVFARRKLPTKQQAELVVMDTPEAAAEARLILDPTAGGSAITTIDWFVPSPDGTKVAVSISSGGSEAGDLHIVDLDGRDLDVVIPDVQRGTGGGDMAWRPDGAGFWYTRYPAPGEKPDDERDFWMQVWWHTLGTPVTDDRYELGADLPKIAEIALVADPRGRVLATVQDGDGGTFRHYLRAAKGGWTQLTDWGDAVVFAGFGPTEDLWLVSRKGAPRGKVLRLDGKRPALARAKVIVPEGADAIVTGYPDRGLVVTKDRLYLTVQLGGPTALRAFTLRGRPAPAPALPPVSRVAQPKVVGDDLVVWSSSFTAPGGYARIDGETGALTTIAALSPPSTVDLSEFEVVREQAISQDGTQVPMSIVWKRGAPRDGSMPCVVNGYGGYGISQEPGFLESWAPVLKRGVCFVSVNTRGGAEFGEAWHRDGALTNKQHVFDDFAAALDHLVARGFTRPERTVILGGSNGGLLMGALLTQHPERVRAVVAQVGIYDMLRVERSPNGQFNITEFGTVADPAQFAALYAYSPYHHVVAGTVYPAVLMTTGANDPRVAPWQSRKMVAALQAAQGGDAPILLRTSSSSGHGAGTAMDERIDAGAHVRAFILDQLGVE